MPMAARTNDPSSHGKPLNPGPGSLDVQIGNQPAWRALPAAIGAALESLSNTMNSFMTSPVMTPANAAAKLAQASQGMIELGAQSAAEGKPNVVATAASQVATLNATNVGLTTTWTTASAAPGGQPAANQAYTEGIKAAAAAGASAVVAAMAGLADMHICPIPVPIPPHGPGFVTKGSSTVLINNLPASRMNDKVMEACGGADPIAMGQPMVDIGG
ncbi:MAG: PAAR domain-containing protein [Phycisphaerae bacterium]